MSYSRWSHSRWYTFWAVGPRGIEDTRDTARFEVNCRVTFRAAELRANMDYCIARVVALEAQEPSTRDGPRVSPAECAELKRYMEQFLEDVDRLTGIRA